MLTAHTLNDQILAHTENAAHAMEVPGGTRMLFCNGQAGARQDGTVPETAAEQLDVIFTRIAAILTAAGMGFEDIVKLTVYVTDKAIFQDFFAARRRLLGAHNPPATLLVISAFPRDGVTVEVEAIAGKAG